MSEHIAAEETKVCVKGWTYATDYEYELDFVLSAIDAVIYMSFNFGGDNWLLSPPKSKLL